MTGEIPESKKRELSTHGLTQTQIDYMDDVVKSAPSGMAPNPPMDKDNLLMQPLSNWGKVDRKGHWGDSVLSVPSRKFKENYGKIEWDK